MQQYIKEIKEIFSATSNQDGFLGIRVCHKDLTSVKALVLGINPSNSIKAFGRTEFRQQLRQDDSVFFDQVLSSQNAYNQFLSFSHYQKNEERICELEICAHAFHPHFQKHNQFAKALGIDEQYAFFDLFPIWEIQQATLLDKLNQKPAVSAQLISAFIQLLIAHPQIQQLYFFNKKSYHLFLEFISIQSTVQILAKKKLEFQIGRQKKSAVFETTVQLGALRTIQVIAFGIGSYSFGAEACQELAKNYLSALK
jgi:hypothetical protein